MESLARELGLSGRVEFRGRLPAGEAIFRELDRADLFVLPSRQEGLPRAMIEAMARALPCIGSTVGGIPELLPQRDLVPPDSPSALADKIGEVARDPSRMARMSARNLEVARGYREEVLVERRTAFYRHLEERTADWLRAGGGGR
jgi:glycosyltransferase involved in cell wall biosynthesis